MNTSAPAWTMEPMPTASSGSPSTNPALRPTCCRATPLSSTLDRSSLPRHPPQRPGDSFGQGQRLHRRRRRQGIHRASRARRRPTSWCAARTAVFDRIESLPCPSVAIIHGFALGGGLELALACRYRVGIKGDKFSIGLPEVMLGIHPGFWRHGARRAPRRRDAPPCR